MLGNTKGKLINKHVPDYVLYDLETTGISSNYDEVIEISAVKVRDGIFPMRWLPMHLPLERFCPGFLIS